MHVTGGELPSPTAPGPVREDRAQLRGERVAGVISFHGQVERACDGLREWKVHLGDPQRQHVGRVRAPLGARTQPERSLGRRVEVEV